MKVKTSFGEYDVRVERSKYRNNNSLAIMLICKSEDGYEEPFATLTVNLGYDDIVDDIYQFVDTNNCPWAEEFIKENNLGTPTGVYGRSGYCSYPLYEFKKA